LLLIFAVKEASFSKKQFQLKLSFVRSDGGLACFHALLLDRRKRMRDLGKKSPPLMFTSVIKFVLQKGPGSGYCVSG
jgi:hypothetical protein